MSGPCFCCGEPIKSCWTPAPGEEDQLNGTRFEAHGNYGSGRFDPSRSASLRLVAYICDTCLGRPELQARLTMYREKYRPPACENLGPWDGRT